MLDVLPQLVANGGVRALKAAIADPYRYAIEPKIDGVRGLIGFRPDGIVETRNRGGHVRDGQRHRPFAAGLRRLAQRLPIVWAGTVLHAELIAARFAGTMAALQGSRRFRDHLRFVVFDRPVPRRRRSSTAVLAGPARAARAPCSRLRAAIRAVAGRDARPVTRRCDG